MSHDVIGTAVMVIATVIITATLLNAIFPTVFSSSDSIRSMGGNADDRVGTSMAFINYEVVSQNQANFDVINTGRTDIPESTIKTMTVYMSAENAPLAILSGNSSGTETYWDYVLTGTDDRWGQGETLTVRIHNPADGFADGNYRVRIQLINGAMSEQAFTVEV